MWVAENLEMEHKRGYPRRAEKVHVLTVDGQTMRTLGASEFNTAPWI